MTQLNSKLHCRDFVRMHCDPQDFFTGESDEEFVSISSNSDKAPRVSWTCEHCTYVNNPGVKVASRYGHLSHVLLDFVFS